MNGQQLEGRTLKVTMDQPPDKEKRANLSVHVSNLLKHVTEDDLHEMFSKACILSFYNIDLTYYCSAEP
jgi:RNA recognition motif-containing protein